MRFKAPALRSFRRRGCGPCSAPMTATPKAEKQRSEGNGGSDCEVETKMILVVSVILIRIMKTRRKVLLTIKMKKKAIGSSSNIRNYNNEIYNARNQ